MSQNSDNSLTIEDLINIEKDNLIEETPSKQARVLEKMVNDKLDEELSNELYFTKVTFTPLDYNMFEVSTSSYDVDVLNHCRNTIGREYNCEKKTWSFPNNQYKDLYNKICTLERVKILRELSVDEVNSIQIVIMADKAEHLVIKLPFNENFNTLIRNHSGVFDRNNQTWCIPASSKDEFLKRLHRLNVKTKLWADKPQCKFYLLI